MQENSVYLLMHSRRATLLGALSLAFGVSQAVRSAEALSKADRGFLAWDIQIEIQQQDMGRLAIRRARTQQVQDFGNYLVERHKQAQQQLQAVADELGVPLSHKLSATHLQVQSRFKSIASASFDKAFVRHEMGDYRYFLSHFDAASHSGNRRVRDYALGQITRLKEGQSKIAGLMANMSSAQHS